MDSSGHSQGAERDGFIPARRSELAAAIAADGGDAALGDVAKLLSALLHHEAYAQLEALKALYDPLDPDAPPARRNVSAGAFEAFEAALIDALTRANFSEIAHDTVQTRDATKLLTGLAIKPSMAGIRSIRYFARGARPDTVELKSWFGLRTQQLPVQVMSDVVVLVGFKADNEIGREDAAAFAKMRRGVRPGAALVKHFRNVATAELVTLHPGAKPSMLGRDRVFLAAPAVATGVPVLLNIWPAMTVLFAVIAAYFGAQGVIDDDEMKRALAAISGLVAVIAFVMRQRLKYEAQGLRYQKRLAETVYFRNLANNGGVIDLLVGAGEEQDAKEALLAYAALVRGGQPMAKGELDMACEAFLRDKLGLDVNFEIQDALAKLERLGLVTRDASEMFSATAPADALARLDGEWDALFNFSARR